MTSPDMHDLVTLYALDALEGEELRSFEAHLASCAECVAELDEDRDLLSRLVPDQPAAEAVWDRIQAVIEVEAADSATAEVIPLRRGGSGRIWKVVSGVAAAAALVFAGLLVAQQGDTGLGPDQIAAAADAAAAEPGSFAGEFLVDDNTVARVVLAADGRGFLLPEESLEPLDAERTYQLWVINDNEDVISAGVLGADPAPSTFTWTGEVTGFALTREVAGGVVSSAGDVVSVITDA